MTRFREAELALRESESLFRSIAENAVFATHIVQDGVYAYVNDAWCEMAHYSREHVLGHSPEELFQENTCRTVERYLQDGRKERRAVRLVTRRGHIFWASVHTRSIIYRGRPAVLGILVDITDLKHTELALRESENRYRALFEYSNDAILLLDGDLVCTDCNQRARDLFGVPPGENLCSRPAWELAPPHQPDGRESAAALRALVAAAAPGTPSPDWLCRRLDGTVFEASLRLSGVVVRGATVVQMAVRDISQRVRAEREVRARERWLGMSAELTRTGSFLWFMDEDVWLPDRSLVGLFGMLPDETKEQPLTVFGDRLPDGDFARFRITVAQYLLKGAGRFSGEFRFRLPNGESRWFAYVGQEAEKGGERRGKTLLVVCRDISRRKEDELRLDHIWQVARLALWEYDPAADVYVGGSHLREMLERSNARIEPGELLDYLHEEDAAAYLAELDASVAERRNVLRLAARVRVHGRIKHLQTVVYQDFDEAGNLVRRYGLHQDVTDEERLNEALREVSHLSRLNGIEFHTRLVRRIAELLGADVCAIARILPGGRHRVRSLAWYGAGEDRGETEWRLDEGENAGLLAGRPWSGIQGRIGDRRWPAYLAIPLFDSEGRAMALLAAGFSELPADDGLSLRILGVFGPAAGAEIERGRYEENLVAAREAAEDASRAKSAFLATMSHEVRTPLNIIMGYSELLEIENLPEEEASYVHSIRVAAQALLNLLNDVLDLSRIEAGKIVIQPRPGRIQDLVDEMQIIFAQRAEAKGLCFTTRVLGAPEPLLLDSERLRQVLLNLLGNAAKFTDQGQIELVAEVCPDTRRRRRLLIRVSDTGIGIAPEDQERVFAYFEQAGKGDARQFPGSGLGLALCRRLVELMGGRITLESQPGKGSVFTLDIRGIQPTKLPPDRSWERHLDQLPQFPGACVLVADDVAENLAVASAALARMGLTPVCADSGTAALDRARESLPDLALIDLRMPDLSGDEVARRLCEMAGPRHLPVVAFTASLEPEKEYRTDLFAEILPKPLSLANLARVLSQYLRPRDRGPSPSAESPLPLHLAGLAAERFAGRFAGLGESFDPIEARDLAEEIRALAEEHAVPSLVILADSLTTAAEDFDLGMVEQLAERFAQLTGKTAGSDPRPA
jgi:PAS domain S-box-containing protein